MKDSPAATPSTARGRAFARAALLGNPSDGFGGKTLGFTFAELEAEVTLGSADDHASDRDEDARRWSKPRSLAFAAGMRPICRR